VGVANQTEMLTPTVGRGPFMCGAQKCIINRQTSQKHTHTTPAAKTLPLKLPFGQTNRGERTTNTTTIPAATASSKNKWYKGYYDFWGSWY